MTAQEMVKRYKLGIIAEGPNAGKLMVGDTIKVQIDNAVPEIKAHISEIAAILKAQAEDEAKAKTERAAKIAAIEGLAEINAAYNSEYSFRRAFNAAMDNEFNDGVNLPKRPTSSVDDLKAKYPRAAAYLRAESWTMSENDGKNAAGKKALERIINGDDYKTVVEEMEAEWSNRRATEVFD